MKNTLNYVNIYLWPDPIEIKCLPTAKSTVCLKITRKIH